MWPCWLLVWMNMMSWGEGPGYKLHNYEFWWDFRITIIISGIRESLRPTAMDTCWRYIYDFVRTLAHSWLDPCILLVTTYNSWFSKSNIRNIIPLVSHSPNHLFIPTCMSYSFRGFQNNSMYPWYLSATKVLSYSPWLVCLSLTSLRIYHCPVWLSWRPSPTCIT